MMAVGAEERRQPAAFRTILEVGHEAVPDNTTAALDLARLTGADLIRPRPSRQGDRAMATIAPGIS
jgi:hypothetical protein